MPLPSVAEWDVTTMPRVSTSVASRESSPRTGCDGKSRDTTRKTGMMRDWGRMGKTSAQDDLPTPAPSAAGRPGYCPYVVIYITYWYSWQGIVLTSRAATIREFRVRLNLNPHP